MKWLFKMFFKTLRIVLTPFMLLWEKMTTPKGIVRQPEAQRLIDQQCSKLALYQFKTCPFCIKVRRELSRLSLNIPLLDAQHQPQHREALLQGGGQVKVPCLKITDEKGNVQWMYESSEIIRYLHERFS
ncbi:MAG: glutathione S-transferase N-terminal domain-containing protein [Sulfuriferula sp.]